MRYLVPTLCFLGTTLLASAGEDATELPPLLVEETHQTRQWSYAAVAGFEFLSLCPDDQAHAFAVGAYRAEQVLGLLLPENMRVRQSVPVAFILYPESLEKGLAEELVAQMKSASTASSQWTDRPAKVVPGLHLDDPDSTIVFSLLGDSAEESFGFSAFGGGDFLRTPENQSGRFLGIEPGFAELMMVGRTPAAPPWFVAGFVELYGQSSVRADAIDVPPFRWAPEGTSERIRSEARAPRRLLPMAQILETRVPAADVDPVALDRRALWQTEAALFIRWAYDGEDARRIAAFRGFVTEACQRAVNERVFIDYFGFGYARMRDILSDYLTDAVVTGYTLRGQIHDPPSFQMATASRDQVARIRGDWERRARRYMLDRSEVLSRSFADQSQHTLEGALRKGTNDPGVWAIQGLLDFDLGRFDQAKAELERAAAGNVNRPMVYFDLANLAYTRIGGQPMKKGFSFTQAQAREVLAPAERGLALEPKLIGDYAIISDVLLHADRTLDEHYLPILYQGAHLYPNAALLMYRTAVLEALNGNRTETEWLTGEALRRNYSPEDRKSFEWLRSRLTPRP